MASKIICLTDDTLVEVDIPDNQVKAISGGSPIKKVDAAIDMIKPIILKACKPISEVYKELDKDVSIEQVELQFGLSFEAEGNLFITKAKGNANLSVKVTIKPKGTNG